MCSTSRVNQALQGLGDSATDSLIASITAHKIRQNRAAYYLVDVREPSEIAAEPLQQDSSEINLDKNTATTPSFPADLCLPLGAICHDASSLRDIILQDNKTIVFICSSGKRAALAASSAAKQLPQETAFLRVLQRGILGWKNASAVVPDFLVVLGRSDSKEKLSLALAACATAVETHETVVLALMADAVDWFVQTDSTKRKDTTAPNVKEVHVGEPFKPCGKMLDKFLSQGGLILACTTCLTHRGYELRQDLMDCVHALQMPDLVRMLGEAKGGSLQFL